MQFSNIKLMAAIFLSMFSMEAYAIGKLVTTDSGEKLWVEQYGSGKPTIILINGGGDTIDTEWRKIIPALSKTTSVIAYDRPGQLKSPGLKDITTPRTAKDVISSLRALLMKLRIDPPYILVAHSIGGLYGLYYAKNFPDEITGLVMINGNLVAEQFPENVKWLSPKMRAFIQQEDAAHVLKLKKQLEEIVKNIHNKPTDQQSEQIEYSLEVIGKKESAKQVMNSPNLSNELVLVVLSSGSFSVEKRMQKEFSQEVPNAIFKKFPNSSHYIQNDNPGDVIKIVRDIVERIHNRSYLELAVDTNDLIIKNVRIINPERTLEPRQGYIVIHHNRIKQVGDGTVKIASNANVYDGKNQYVIPGLIDSHNHIDTVLGLSDQQYTSHPKLVSDYQKQLPRSYLYFGYTTIIDLASSDRNAIRIFNSSAAHPDLYTCGGGIMIANGYPMNYLPEEVRFDKVPNFLYDPHQKIKLPSHIDPAQHTPSAIIKRIVSSHAVCVKIFYEPGFDEEKILPLPSLSSVREIVKLAHQHHLPVLMHANSYEAQKFFLASGADISAHGLWNWGTYENEFGLPDPIKNILYQITQRQLGYQPTMQVMNGLSASVNTSFLDDPQLPNVIPVSLLSWYKTKEGQWYSDLITGNVSKATVEKRFQLKENQLQRVVNYLQKNHANLLFGTDTPSSPTYGNPPGYNGYLEMNDWHRADVPLSDILIAATIRNAKFFHLEKKYGSLAPGKIANLVIMKKNPLQDISAYDSITSIVLHGKIYPRSEFLANKK
jgi:imidazolonepropionase-like amidohydrolase/pimeloyl-ACP methyl ester carboxylesterase